MASLKTRCLLSDEVLGFWSEYSFLRELESLSPVHDLAVCLRRGFRAEWRISAKHLEHDDSYRPPITFLAITLLHEYLRGDVIGRTYSGVGLIKRRGGKGTYDTMFDVEDTLA